jgi:hypothetical protein
MNILILMDMPLFPYRIYAYNELSNRGYDLTVISVSDEDTRYDLPLKFEHIRLEKKAIGGFVKLEHFSQIEPNKYDVIVVDPNLRMLDYYQFYRNKYWDKLISLLARISSKEILCLSIKSFLNHEAYTMIQENHHKDLTITID